jgi:ATP-dependent Lon protease
MNFFSLLRSSSAATVRSCTRVIASEAGPSRQWAQLARQRRSFNTSTTHDYQPSQPALYPRWINRAQPLQQAEADDLQDGHDSRPVRMNSPEDGNAPPDSSAPPSSSSSSSGDGSDSSSSDPPPPPPPPNPPAPAQTSISKQSVPEIYPQVLALPIARRPLFPGFYKAVVVRDPAVVAAIKEMMKRGQSYLGAFLLKDEHADSDVIKDINSVHPVGVFAQITSVFAANSGPGAKEGEEEGLTAVLYPHRRIRITELVQPGGMGSMAKVEPLAVPPADEQPAQVPTPPATPEPGVQEPLPQATEVSAALLQTSFLRDYDISIVRVDNLATQPYNKDDQYIRAFMSEIVSVFKDIAQLNPLFRDQITNFSINQVASNVFDEPDKLADFAAAVSSGDVQELQDVLESLVVEDRLRKALLVLKKELINAQLQSKLSRDVDSKIAKRQREYYLMEQLKGIKKELGMESDGKDKMIEKFKERAASLKMPEGVKKVFDEELNKLQHLEPAASEANVTRNYLEWLTQVFIPVIPLSSYDLNIVSSDPVGSILSRELFNPSCSEGPRRRSLWLERCQGPNSRVPRCW